MFDFKSVKSVKSLKQEFFQEIWHSALLELEFKMGEIDEEIKIGIVRNMWLKKR
jgi:hypothetical protein